MGKAEQLEMLLDIYGKHCEEYGRLAEAWQAGDLVDTAAMEAAAYKTEETHKQIMALVTQAKE